VFPNPDRLRRLHPTPSAFFGRPRRFDLHDVRTVQLRFVVEECDELSPRCVLLVPSVSITLKHSSNVEVFHEHGIVLTDEPRRNLVLVVQHLPTNVALDFGDRPALLLVVVRPFILSVSTTASGQYDSTDQQTGEQNMNLYSYFIAKPS
jgi:hypothetical protein